MFPDFFFPRFLDGANFNPNTLQDYQHRLEELSTSVLQENQDKNALHQLSHELSQAAHTAAANAVIDRINCLLAGQSNPLTSLLNLPTEIHVEILAKLRHLQPIDPFATINHQFHKATSYLQKKIYEEVVDQLTAEIQHDYAFYEAFIQASDAFVELSFLHQTDEHAYKKAWNKIVLFFSSHQDSLIGHSFILSNVQNLCKDGLYANNPIIFYKIRVARLKCRSILFFKENLIKLNLEIKNELHRFGNRELAQAQAHRSKLDFLLFNLFLTAQLYKKREASPLFSHCAGFNQLVNSTMNWNFGFSAYPEFKEDIMQILSHPKGDQIFGLACTSVFLEQGLGIPIELYKMEKFELRSQPAPRKLKNCIAFIFHLKEVFNLIKETDRFLLTKAILVHPQTFQLISQDVHPADALFIINFIKQLSYLKKHETILHFTKNHLDNPLSFLVILDTLYGCGDLSTIERIFAQFNDHPALQHPKVGLIKDLLTSSITLEDLYLKIDSDVKMETCNWFIPMPLYHLYSIQLPLEAKISSFFYYFLAKFIHKNQSLDDLAEFIKKFSVSSYIIDHLIQTVDELDLILKIYPLTSKKMDSFKLFTRLLMEKIGTEDPILEQFLLRNLGPSNLKKNPLNLNDDKQKSINSALAWANYTKKETYFKKTVQEIEEALRLHQNILIEASLWDELKKHQALPLPEPINLLYGHPQPSAFCYFSAAPRMEQIGKIFKYYSSFKSPNKALYYEHLSTHFSFAKITIEGFKTLWKRLAKVTSLKKTPFFHQFLIRYVYQQLIQDPYQNSQQFLTLLKAPLKLSEQFLKEIQVYLNVFSPNFASSLQSLSLEESSPYDHLILEHPHYTAEFLVKHLNLVERIMDYSSTPQNELILQALIERPYPTPFQLLKGCELLFQLYKSCSENKHVHSEQIAQLCGRLVQSFENSATESSSFASLAKIEKAVKKIRENLTPYLQDQLQKLNSQDEKGFLSSLEVYFNLLEEAKIYALPIDHQAIDMQRQYEDLKNQWKASPERQEGLALIAAKYPHLSVNSSLKRKPQEDLEDAPAKKKSKHK